jgi:hypothetical protein
VNNSAGENIAVISSNIMIIISFIVSSNEALWHSHSLLLLISVHVALQAEPLGSPAIPV